MIIPSLNGKGQLRGVAVLPYRKWPNNIIPYDISPITGKIIVSFKNFFNNLIE